MSPNGELLIFSHRKFDSRYWSLILKKNTEEQYFFLADGQTNARRAKFSPSGRKIAFHKYSETTNQLVVADYNHENNSLQNEKVVFDIPLGFLSVYLDWQDEETIFFSRKEVKNEPYRISSISLTDNNNVVDITHPSNNGHGDLSLSFSAESNKLAILRNIAWIKSEIHSFDPETGELGLITTIPRVLLSVAWNYDGSGIIYRSGAGELSEMMIGSKETKPLIKAAAPIYGPFQIDKKSYGFMRGEPVVSDIEVFDLTSGESLGLAVESSFNDSLPAYAAAADKLAFVSNRSGLPQIWLNEKDKSGKVRLTQLTNFERSARLLSLSIDPLGTYLVFTTEAQLNVLNIKTGEIIFNSGSNSAEHAYPTFSSNGQKIYYTVKDGANWRIEERRVDSLKIRKVLTDGFFARGCPLEDCIYLIKRDSTTLHKLLANGTEIDTNIDVSNVQFVDQFQILGESILVVSKGEQGNKLKNINLITGEETVIANASSSRFFLDNINKRIFWSKNRLFDTNISSIKYKN
ncbi:MAG: hypothetical protein OQK04_11460, partial [Kangiellaceae bacterium]|nr:hypothetical protein [Kangiellaceae bacterium]